jgi:hypothetical protein
MRRVELLDTSIVVELLEIPGESARRDATVTELDRRAGESVELQMPIASVVEAGGHVCRIVDGHQRRECAGRLAAMVRSTLDRVAPWSFTSLDWDETLLSELVAPTDPRAPALVDSFTRQFLEMGDLLIVAEFRRLRDNLDLAFVDVDVWTYDGNLRAVIDDLRR